MPERTEDKTYRDSRFLDEEEGSAIGLTEAFAPLGDDFLESHDRAYLQDEPACEESLEDASCSIDETGGFRRSLDGEEEEPEEPVKRGRHARHAMVEPDFDDEPAGLGVIGAAADFAEADDAVDQSEPAAKRRRKHAADELPRYMKKSRRMRSILIAAIVALVLLAAAGAFYTWQLFETAQQAAVEQAGVSSGDKIIDAEATDDASSVAAKKVSAPNLAGLLGMTEDAALAQLGEGAQLISRAEFDAEGNRLGEDAELAYVELSLSLTDGASDSRMGYPSVYLDLDAEGVVQRAGYSTTTTLLGFGSQSFEDVVENGRIVEVTLEEAGVGVSAGSVSLPDDKTAYSTYAEDGTTLVKEYCSFSGTSEAGEGQIDWSAVLSYDYAMYNATGNLGDTVRVIYVYVE